MKGHALMAKTYRVTFAVRASNWLVERLLRAGVKMGFKDFPMVLLTVRGRKSGQPRTTPVVLSERDGKRYLIGTFGEVNWVRNLRAAGQATLTRGRRTEAISVTELPTAEAVRFLKQVVSTAPGFIRGYFDVTPASSLEEFEREAPRHPVFLVSRLLNTPETPRVAR
jgi:deazaflavin-dependent oxidoreductase (nitroreductase family)